MQKSIVSINGETAQLRLSGLFSEWLFSSKFWAEFNEKNGTMFDQFEEDEADIFVINAIVAALDRRVSDLQKSNCHNVEFIYRWTSDKQPIKKIVPTDSLLSELLLLRAFLVDVISKNKSVTFVL